MTFQDFFSNPNTQKFGVTVASLYAKRMLEVVYDRAGDTDIMRKAKSLSRPNKLVIEGALYSLVGYLSTKESRFADTPLKSFLWEVAKDGPSEIAKRLLNGTHASNAKHSGAGVIDVDVTKAEEITVMEGLLRMPPADLAAFLAWLQSATPEERRWMAEAMAGLSEEQQAKLAKLTPEQAKLLLKTMTPTPQPTPPAERGVAGSMADSLRALNERLEKRKP